MELQKKFPAGPVFEAPSCDTLSHPEGSKRSEKREVRAVLGELNARWETRYDHKITSVLPTMAPECNLARKQTRVESKRKDRQMKKKIATHVTEQMKENATPIHLAESESLATYSRKQYAISYEKTSKKNKNLIHPPKIKHGTRKRQY